MPIRVQHSLETWRAAERELERVRGTPDRASAEEAVFEAREAYIAAIRALAEGHGTTGIDRVPGAAGPVTPFGQVSFIRAAAATLQRESDADQQASASDQKLSDADQRESDADVAALLDGGRRIAGDTQAQSSIRRLASSATRDANAAARDATADERDAVMDKLDGVRRLN